MWLTFLLCNRRTVCTVTAIACLVGFGSLQTIRLNLSKHETAKKIEELAKVTEVLNYERASFASQVKLAKEKENEATMRYTEAVEAAKLQYSKDIEAARTSAWNNYVARYGNPRIGGCGAPRLQLSANPSGVRIPLPADSASAGKAEGDQSDDGPSREFVAACARDAARLNQWIRIATDTQFEVVETKE